MKEKTSSSSQKQFLFCLLQISMILLSNPIIACPSFSSVFLSCFPLTFSSLLFLFLCNSSYLLLYRYLSCVLSPLKTTTIIQIKKENEWNIITFSLKRPISFKFLQYIPNLCCFVVCIVYDRMKESRVFRIPIGFLLFLCYFRILFYPSQSRQLYLSLLNLKFFRCSFAFISSSHVLLRLPLLLYNIILGITLNKNVKNRLSKF